MHKLKKYYSELHPTGDSIGPLPLHSKANNPELDNNDVVRALQIELNQLTEKVDTLTERMNQWEIDLPIQTDAVYCSRI